MDLNLLEISGVKIPIKKLVKYDVSLSDIDSEDTGRTETGKLSRDVIRKDVTKIELAWEDIIFDDVTTILGAINHDELSVSYFFGEMKNATMYAGDRKLSKKRDLVNQEQVWDVSFNLIEY